MHPHDAASMSWKRVNVAVLLAVTQATADPVSIAGACTKTRATVEPPDDSFVIVEYLRLMKSSCECNTVVKR